MSGERMLPFLLAIDCFHVFWGRHFLCVYDVWNKKNRTPVAPPARSTPSHLIGRGEEPHFFLLLFPVELNFLRNNTQMAPQYCIYCFGLNKESKLLFFYKMNYSVCGSLLSRAYMGDAEERHMSGGRKWEIMKKRRWTFVPSKYLFHMFNPSFENEIGRVVRYTGSLIWKSAKMQQQKS